MVQGVGLAFLFVPINNLAFYFVPRDKTNYAAGLINLARNIGGSCGIAFAATMLSRWTQTHQNYLIANLSPLNPQMQIATQAATGALVQQGQAPAVAANQAQQLIYSNMARQASMMSFDDVFFLMAVTFLILIPLLFMLKKAPPHREGDLTAVH
jgi:DHA2 family multidrug resistance protein